MTEYTKQTEKSQEDPHLHGPHSPLRQKTVLREPGSDGEGRETPRGIKHYGSHKHSLTVADPLMGVTRRTNSLFPWLPFALLLKF